MNISPGQRAAMSRAQAGRLRLSLSKLPTTLRESIINSQPCNGIIARNIWWFSRRNDWSMDEDMEERFLRHQKMMRNRYSKLLRRRSIWEGDEHSQSPVWARSRRWLVTRWADQKALSYQRALCSEMQEPGKWSEHERPWKEWDRDFDKLKVRIDEQIERDPYGTLFGRHLRGPPSPNNSSWTSFSWIYGPLRCMQRDISNTSPDGMQDSAPINATITAPSEPITFSVAPEASSSAQSSRVSPAEQEYEFDPISMRKVLKPKTISPQSAPSIPTTTSQTPPKKAFLETLFSEHGVDIPIKTYKPHKVYGHGGPETVAAKSTEGVAPSKPKISGIDLESSRLRDLQALKFRTLGNSIDTTAEYGGKYKNPADPEPIHIKSVESESATTAPVEEASKQHDVKDVTGEDTEALFTGTTYEAKAKAISSITATKPPLKTSWLEKEGFQTLPQVLSKSGSGNNEPDEPKNVGAGFKSSRIEPALDRVKAYDVKLRSRQEVAACMEPAISTDKSEDVDLLRASDIRAATRSARLTRLEKERDKQETRKKLETDYSKHQRNGAARFAINGESTTGRVSRSLSNVWDHVKQYPQGIVAKTINSMGVFNENYKTYVRLDKPLQDSTEKLVFRDDTLSKTPSIYKKVGKKPSKPLQAFTPSQEVLDVEKAEKARLEFVRQVNEEAKRKALLESRQAESLASNIRNAYEEQYGKIDINHRQAKDAENVSVESVSPRNTDVTEFKKPAAALQPMGPATVKPGIIEDPVIKDHVSIFEPKLAKIVDEAKSARKAIHEAKLEVMALRSRRPQTVWSGRSTDAASISAPKPENARIEPALDRTPKEQQSSESTIQISEPPSQPKYNSEYIILAYDPSSNTVTISPLDSSVSSEQDNARKTGIPQILASLNHTAKFLSYFTSLSNQGYEVVSGGGDVLIFKRRGLKTTEPIKSPLLTHVKAIIDKNKLAAQNTSAQPAMKTIPVRNVANPEKKAATVLDELPASEPRPGPAGPTAPPMGPPSFMRPKVRRQENVFSASKASRVSSPPSSSTTKKDQEEAAKKATTTQEGLWTRFKRGVKRVILTAAAMGVGAYSIGAVAESLGAQPQSEKAIRRGRPGIYSTENSR